VTARIAPWQVWWANFDPQAGRERAGQRPAVIVGTQLACGLPTGLAVVVPMTTRDRGLPFQPAVQLGDKTGYAMTDQIKAISTDRLISRHRARLASEEIDAIRFALRRIVDVAGS